MGSLLLQGLVTVSDRHPFSRVFDGRKGFFICFPVNEAYAMSGEATTSVKIPTTPAAISNGIVANRNTIVLILAAVRGHERFLVTPADSPVGKQ
jgi:hypothetical protein